MPKTSFEKAIEKQVREQKRLAQKEKMENRRIERKRKQDAIKQARIERALSIVQASQREGNMVVMNKTYEEMLYILLENFSGDVNQLINENVSIFPQYIQKDIELNFEVLKDYGMISLDFYLPDGTFSLYLTPDAIEYFEKKEKIMQESSKTRLKQHSKYDVFISHANKDKEDLVKKLYQSFNKLGINIFYDTESLEWGDNWKAVILDGTQNAEFAVIVVSKNFFGREWTEKELNEFLSRQNSEGQKIILPILHGITIDELKNEYPTIADIHAIDSANHSCDEIALMFAKQLIKRLKAN